jgi:hypothetical protein
MNLSQTPREITEDASLESKCERGLPLEDHVLVDNWQKITLSLIAWLTVLLRVLVAPAVGVGVGLGKVLSGVRNPVGTGALSEVKRSRKGVCNGFCEDVASMRRPIASRPFDDEMAAAI